MLVGRETASRTWESTVLPSRVFVLRVEEGESRDMSAGAGCSGCSLMTDIDEECTWAEVGRRIR